MRLMSTKATRTYIDVIDRAPYTEDTVPLDAEGNKRTALIGRPNPEGEPVEGATVWHFRGLTSGEEGALTDAMFDMGGTTVDNQGPADAKVNVGMRVSPSKNRRHRIQLALAGWDGLYGEDGEDGNPTLIEYVAEKVTVGGQQFTGAPGAVLDMIPGDMQARMDKFVRGISAVEPGTGER